MPTTLTNGIQLPDKGSVDWYSSMQSNYNLIDTHLGDTDIHVTAEDKANWDSKQGSLSQDQLDAIAQVAINTDDIATLQSDKADASHTHSSSDITDIGDYATKDYVDTSISGLVDNAPDALNTLNELSAALNDDSNFASTVTTALSAKANSADLATVATSGSYTDLTDKPTIPTNTSDLTNDSDFVVSSNLATIATSGDYDDLSNKPSIPTNTSDLNNDSGFITLNDFDIPAKTSDLTNDSGFITSSDVPTGTSDLINDSNFVDTSNPAVASGITSAKVTAYDSHVEDTDIHVTTADKNKWNNNTYVFRYSSTALVASSTNSNTLLDNTDNLKVGDKVIDSNGVLFSITAIDTANSTFTIGTALIDLAQDSDVVHKSGNETISGDKVFNTRLIKNIDVVLGTAPSTGKFSNIDIADNNKTSFLQIMGGVYNNGNSYARFFVQNKTADDGTGLSPTGTLRTCGFNISLPTSSTSEGQGSITPRGNKTTDFGLFTYQWRNVWCEKLYLNGTQLDPSAFVTTDTAQTISGGKTFSSPTRIYNASATVQADVPSLVFKNSLVERASTTLDGEQTILFTDKNDNNIGSIQAKTYTSGTSDIILTSYSEYNGVKTTGIVIRRTLTTSKLQGFSDNITDLGDTNRRWRRVYAMNYYYGSDNVEFSTKFVTTDTNQTISGTKTFSSNVNVYNSDSTTDTANIVLKNSKAERGSTTNIGEQNIFFLDKNNAQIGNIKCEVDSTGVSTLTLQCTNSSNGSSGIRLRRTSTGTFLYPVYNNGCNLGTSGYRWYDVQTKGVNGVEPSSLSLPSDNANDVIDISSYLTYLDGTDNTYVAPANGWITINMNNCSGIHATIAGFWGDSRVRASAGAIKFLMPVLKNQTVTLTIHGGTINNARFIPCQGNV